MICCVLCKYWQNNEKSVMCFYIFKIFDKILNFSSINLASNIVKLVARLTLNIHLNNNYKQVHNTNDVAILLKKWQS